MRTGHFSRHHRRCVTHHTAKAFVFCARVSVVVCPTAVLTYCCGDVSQQAEAEALRVAMMRAMSALSDTAAVSLNQPKLLNLRLTIMVSAGGFSAVCCYAFPR